MSRLEDRALKADSGGVKIPDQVKCDVEKRIMSVAEKHYKGRYTRLNIRFRGQFCYIDAYQEPLPNDDWPPENWHETREEYVERIKNTPVHLYRLRYFGKDKWDFATYLSNQYGSKVNPQSSDPDREAMMINLALSSNTVKSIINNQRYIVKSTDLDQQTVWIGIGEPYYLHQVNVVVDLNYNAIKSVGDMGYIGPPPIIETGTQA